MTPSLLIRPVLAIFLTAGLSACGMVDSDPHRFENLAERVAAVPVGDSPAVLTPAMATRSDHSGLRPALKVEVMDPHTLWDVRDGIARPAGQAAAEAATRVITSRDIAASVAPEPARTGLRPAVRSPEAPRADLRPALPPVARPARGLVQLGAYSSPAAARAAWARLNTGSAAWALEGLTPVYEPVEVNGRQLVRLKVSAPASGASAVCAAAGVDDPWCRRTA